MTRPRFHLTPLRGWMNDPVGITWHDGRYHVFFQHVSEATSWALSCAWGHASTTDFVTWEHHPTAIAAGDGDDGCWSGGLVPASADGPARATLFYSAVTADQVQVSRVRVATAQDDAWEAWAKHDVVVEAPAELDLVVFRDPVVQRGSDGWLMLVGGGLADGTACVVAFTTTDPDLRAWEYAGLLASRRSEPGDELWTGRAWECPQLVRVGDHHVLVVSTWADDETLEVIAAVGSYADGRFHAERWQRLGHGPAPYAATTFRDAVDRPTLMAWLRGVEDHDEGWAGAQGVPLLLDVVDGEVRLSVHPDLGLTSAPGEEPSTGWDLRWSPRDGDVVRIGDGDVVRIGDGDRPLAELRHAGDHVEVRRGDEVDRVPATRDDVRVLLDGPALEVLTGAALLGAALPVTGPVGVTLAGDGTLDARRVG